MVALTPSAGLPTGGYEVVVTIDVLTFANVSGYECNIDGNFIPASIQGPNALTCVMPMSNGSSSGTCHLTNDNCQSLFKFITMETFTLLIPWFSVISVLRTHFPMTFSRMFRLVRRL